MKKKEYQKMSKVLNLRMSDDEHAQLKSKANAAGLTMANYLRQGIGTKEVKRSPVLKRTKRDYIQVDPALMLEISRIGNNLNQIARVINQDGSKDNIELLEHLVSIERLLRDIRDAH
jgi:hypothetical protein